MPFLDFDELVSLMIIEEINMQGESSEKVVNKPKHSILVQEGDMAGSLQEAVVWDVVVITSKIG